MISIILYVIGAMNITRYAMISLWENLTQSASGASYPIPSPQHDLHHPFDRSRSCLRDRDMEKLVFCWFVLLTLLSLSSSATAQDTFPVGAVIGIVFGVLGVCISFAVPVGIWICIFCGAAYAAKRQNQRPVNSFVVQSSATPHPPPGSYPTQSQPTTTTTSAYPSAYPAYPVQQPSDPAYPVQPPTNPAYPDQQPSAPYPSAPAYPDAPPPYAPGPDSKQPL